jgi:hypothetical protein
MSTASRTRRNIFSALPTLVPCQPGDENGFLLKPQTLVQIVDNSDLLTKTKQFRRAGVTALEHGELVAVRLLLQARDRSDFHAARKAMEHLRPKIKINAPPGPLDLVGFAFDAVESGMFLAGFISDVLARAKLVYWQQGKAPNYPALPNAPQLRPGVYCPDFKTACAVKMLFGNVRVCLHCNALFESERSNQDHCCSQHREAHRMARWRIEQEKKKLKASRKRRKQAGRKKGRN